MHKGTMRRVKLALVGLAATTMLSGAALAADISRPVYKAPPAGALPVTYDWTGFYIGGHVGYGWADKHWTDAFGLNTSHTSDGFLGGGQAGFNYQINQLVLGIEGDVSWANLKGGSAQTFGLAAPITSTFNSEVDWTSTLTGRLGVAFDRWLVYGKGGVAWAGDRYSTTRFQAPGTIAEITDTRWGWTAGAGVEYAFAPQWSAKLEYNYMDFGSQRYSFAPGTFTDIDQQIHAVKFGINYKFGYGGPVVARY